MTNKSKLIIILVALILAALCFVSQGSHPIIFKLWGHAFSWRSARSVSLMFSFLLGTIIRKSPAHRQRAILWLTAFLVALGIGVYQRWHIKAAHIDDTLMLVAIMMLSLTMGLVFGATVVRQRRALLSSATLLVAVGISEYWREQDSFVCADCNVIIISVDALRPDHLGCYGYGRATSPNIDTLAEKSLLFTNAVTVRGQTMPSLATMLTGLNPVHSGVRVNQSPLLPPDSLTIARVLRRLEYRTAAIVSNPFLRDPLSNFGQGFTHYDAQWSDLDQNGTWIPERNAEKTNLAVRRWLSEISDAKFFLWIHYIDPHGPYHAPGKYSELFSHIEPRMVPAKEIPPYQYLPFPVEPGEMVDLNRYVDAYDNEIAYVDAAIGELLNLLEVKKKLSRSLIILTADHGESLWQHNCYLTHGCTLHEDSVRIPLLIRLPDHLRPPARTTRQLASIVDISPTIIEFVGQRVPKNLDGVSLVKMLSKDVPLRRFAALEILEGNEKTWGIRSSTRKLIRRPSGEYQCYNLSKDPNEQDPNGCSESEVRWLDIELNRYLNESRAGGGADKPLNFNEDTTRILRTLGYL